MTIPERRYESHCAYALISESNGYRFDEKPMSGNHWNNVYRGEVKVKASDEILQVLWKPTEDKMREVAPDPHLRESAAYEIARIVDVRVPATVAVPRYLINVHGGSIQRFIANAIPATFANIDYLVSIYPQEWLKIAVFDFVIGSCDRHTDNMMVDVFGNTWLIDNARCLPDEGSPPWPGSRAGMRPMYMRRSPITAAIKALYELKREEMHDIVHLRGLYKGLAGMERRISTLLRAKTVADLPMITL